jgi:hypothetical protein
VWWYTLLIPTTQERERGRSWFEAKVNKFGQKLVRPCLKSKPGMMIHTCNTSYLGREVVVLESKVCPGKSMRPYLKNKLKWQKY